MEDTINFKEVLEEYFATVMLVERKNIQKNI